MIDNPFRAKLPKYCQPLLFLYEKLGVTPNQITYAGCVLGFASATLVALHQPIWAILVWWLGRLLDGTDGIWARATGSASPLGAFVDIVCDMAAYSAMILGFAYAYPELTLPWMLILFAYVLCITSALALGMQEAEAQLDPNCNRGLRLGAGLAEGGETGIAYTLFLLFPAALTQLVWIWIAILAITIVTRYFLAKELKAA